MTYKIILIGHIICGFLALTLGLIPMFAKKGSPIHVFWGKIYVFCMYGVSLGAILLFLLNPSKIFLQFLAGVAVLSFYLTFSGVRSVQIKNSKSGPGMIDWIALLICGVSGIISLGLGIYHSFRIKNGDSLSTAVLFIAFGLFLLKNARVDFLNFRKVLESDSKKWFFHHLIRMSGAYTATFTAFCVVNNHYFPDLIAWFAPGLLASILITRTVLFYKKKFKYAEVNN